jgi:hypothetical protein
MLLGQFDLEEARAPLARAAMSADATLARVARMALGRRAR